MGDDEDHEKARVAFRALGGALVGLGRRLSRLSRKDFADGKLITLITLLRKEAGEVLALFEQVAAELDDPAEN